MPEHESLSNFHLAGNLHGVPFTGDPTASWEKLPPPEPELPVFEPGPPEGAFEHPVVDPDAADLAVAIPSIGRVKRRHRRELERVVIDVAHVAPPPPAAED